MKPSIVRLSLVGIYWWTKNGQLTRRGSGANILPLSLPLHPSWQGRPMVPHSILLPPLTLLPRDHHLYRVEERVHRVSYTLPPYKEGGWYSLRRPALCLVYLAQLSIVCLLPM